jgi:histidine triad (HIT) family protein
VFNRFKRGGQNGTPESRNEEAPSSQSPTEKGQCEDPSESCGEETVNDCIFCKIIAGQIPSTVIFEDEDVFAFRDVNPQAPQHVLVVPKKHIEKLNDLTANDTLAAGKLLVATCRIAREHGMDGQGYRIVLNNGADAGQSVWHIHAHLLSGRPFRWPPG